MLYYLFYPLHSYSIVFNVFRYITFRTAYASLTALLISLLLGPWLIGRLKEFQIGQQIRQEGPASHQAKAGTPTMGGILILISIIVPTLLWADLGNPYIWIVILSTLTLGVLGFMDDYLKLVRQRSLGLTGRKKILVQVGLSVAICGALIILSNYGSYSTRLSVPFFKRFTPDLAAYCVLGLPLLSPLLLFVTTVIVGSSNAVNLTDGLDGLAVGCVLIAASALTVLTYVTGHSVFAHHLGLIWNPKVSELVIFCGAMVGASLGFLWYNAYPAEIFMGDVGSLSLGGALGTVAVLIKQELLLIMIGGVFVMEALSVILQVASFKMTGKRIFLMSPLHHHFELLGWKESKIVIRFWIAAIVFTLFSLTTLKLR
ncbi:MAG: phospho-N-acetylmuramoyl-pentapeptide-transferase [Acidobacteria bacterium]|nr:phospho-N-acetylmuramoyl-pentapeptide-transferase [Acidobacteriota bacterium]MBI3657798.1 phospho-N-acetylmuramoyl-pentapeptide-transferase [Acidobacteriota bacterium]